MTETTVVVKSGSVVAERPSQNSGSGGDERRWFRFVRRVKRRGFLMVETSALVNFSLLVSHIKWLIILIFPFIVIIVTNIPIHNLSHLGFEGEYNHIIFNNQSYFES